MNRCRKLLMGTLLVAITLTSGNLLAATAPAPPPKKEKKPKVYAKIAAVDAVKNTVTITDVEGKDTEYIVGLGTIIYLDGKIVKFAALTIDLRVDISVNGGKLTRIDATTPPAEKPDKKK